VLLAGLEITALLYVMFVVLLERGAKQSISRILLDEQTVHWAYRPKEWQYFSTQAWRWSHPPL
jgi:hypothetical protein